MYRAVLKYIREDALLLYDWGTHFQNLRTFIGAKRALGVLGFTPKGGMEQVADGFSTPCLPRFVEGN
jgi:hypothetical protein